MDAESLKSMNIDVKVFQKKKSMAQGMLDLALLSANANQLRYILDTKQKGKLYYASLSMISISLALQLLVAVALLLKKRYKNDAVVRERYGNYIMIGILLITIVNVVSSPFAPALNETSWWKGIFKASQCHYLAFYLIKFIII